MNLDLSIKILNLFLDKPFAKNRSEGGLKSFVSLRSTQLHAINEIDENWRKQIYDGQIEYKEEDEKRIGDLYKKWLLHKDEIVEEITAFQDKAVKITVKRTTAAGTIPINTISEFEKLREEFLADCREVEGILTSDDEFFVGQKLADLCDDAIDELRENGA